MSNIQAPRILISAPSSGSGKTTLTLSIIKALTNRGVKVQPYKCGPDYVDTEFHTQAAQRAADNLDTFLLTKENILNIIAHNAQHTELSIIEAAMGLFDGIGTTIQGSSAEVAALTQTPVVLVIPGGGLSYSAAAIVNGFKGFEPGVNIEGVIITGVSGKAHYELIKKPIEDRTGVRCFGFLPKLEEVTLPSRRLGLVPFDELEGIEKIYDKLAQATEEYIDLDGLTELGMSAPPIEVEKNNATAPNTDKVVIAYAKDKAFSFYYKSSLDALRAVGAKLVPFSPLNDKALPKDACALYIGGGYPELFAKDLASNKKMIQTIKAASESGMPIYAESGGYLYLFTSLKDDEENLHDFCDIFSGTALIGKNRARRFGYVQVTVLEDTFLCNKGTVFPAHEFHHTLIEGEGEVFEAKKASGTFSWRTGDVVRNTLGTYTHINFLSCKDMANNFVQAALEYKRSLHG